MKALLALSLLLVLGACSTVPEPIRSEPDDAPSLREVSRAPDQYLGKTVRWGGTIANVQNTAEESRIEIVARRLYRNGEPRQEDHSEGRFIAIVPGFVDPAVYATSRRLTVTGEFQGISEGPLGELTYRYPQVKVSAYYLWPVWRNEARSDPYYGYPWYPYGYPYWPYYDPFWRPYWHPYPW